MSWKQKLVASLIAAGLIGIMVSLLITLDKSDFYVLVEINLRDKYLATSIDTKSLRDISRVTCKSQNGDNMFYVNFYGNKAFAGGQFPFTISLYGPEPIGFPSLRGDMPQPSRSYKTRDVSIYVAKPISFNARLLTFLDKKERDDMLSYDMAVSKERGSLLDCKTHD